jgi:hypothetical protein
VQRRSEKRSTQEAWVRQQEQMNRAQYRFVNDPKELESELLRSSSAVVRTADEAGRSIATVV